MGKPSRLEKRAKKILIHHINSEIDFPYSLNLKKDDNFYNVKMLATKAIRFLIKTKYLENNVVSKKGYQFARSPDF